MSDHNTANYDRAVEIAEGVFWVGFFDTQTGLHSNPYLIIDNDEVVVIDGGSRPDFATVMMKILQTGILPSQITALLYHHYDPDLCGSISNFEDIIENKSLKVISANENFMFIQHYSMDSKPFSIDAHHNQFSFSSGRTLKFIRTPYAHSQGSFVTFDPTSGILFTSDLFGSLSSEWDLFLTLSPQCMACVNVLNCPEKKENCPIRDVLDFHKNIMPSEKALKYALKQMLAVPFQMIAPQHGSLMSDATVIAHVIHQLTSLQDVGIDKIIGNDFDFNFNHLENLRLTP